MNLNPDMPLSRSQLKLFKTSFSNSPCWSNYCLKTILSTSYPFENNPKQGSSQTELPEVCSDNFFGGKTTYKIEKVFKSSGNSVVIRFYDELYQPNAIDKTVCNNKNVMKVGQWIIWS